MQAGSLIPIPCCPSSSQQQQNISEHAHDGRRSEWPDVEDGHELTPQFTFLLIAEMVV